MNTATAASSTSEREVFAGGLSEISERSDLVALLLQSAVKII